MATAIDALPHALSQPSRRVMLGTLAAAPVAVAVPVAAAMAPVAPDAALSVLDGMSDTLLDMLALLPSPAECEAQARRTLAEAEEQLARAVTDEQAATWRQLVERARASVAGWVDRAAYHEAEILPRLRARVAAA